MSTRYLVGDVRARCEEIADGTVSLVGTSPPFMVVRTYLDDEHPDKPFEIGQEASPAEFIDSLLACTAEWGRVLAPWGSIAIELGDTYSGSGGAGGDYAAGGMREGQGKFTGSAKAARGPRNELRGVGSQEKAARSSDGRGNPRGMRDATFQGANTLTGGGAGWPGAKSLALIPQAYALSLAYGRNIFTGEPSPAGWWLVRNIIVWHRTNPSPGSLGDKFRPSTSYITVATKAKDRWFDLTAVRLASVGANTHARTAKGVATKPNTGKVSTDTNKTTLAMMHMTAGAPPLDCWFDEFEGADLDHLVWTITSQASSLAHYAMWPPKLAERLVLSMCPLEVCRHCGEPRRRIESSEQTATRNTNGQKGYVAGSMTENFTNRTEATVSTLGWTHCGCAGGTPTTWRTELVEWIDDAGETKSKTIKVVDDFGTQTDPDQYRPGVVLDPFAGTGTTLAVADFHGRDAIGIDLDERNPLLYEARRAEVEKALNPTRIKPIVGQLGMEFST